jgi:hypothetical protein
MAFEIIRHRINTVRELAEVGPLCGAEVDIRSRGGRLILAHNPHTDGESLPDYLDAFARSKREGTLILNPKEDGLEDEILALLAARGIRNYFFLDLTFPTMVRLAVRGGNDRVAVRVSEYESAETAMKLKGMAGWVWLDCFSGNPPPAEVADRLREHFKICLVSPELEGYPAERIPEFLALRPRAAAVCTKHEQAWR